MKRDINIFDGGVTSNNNYVNIEFGDYWRFNPPVSQEEVEHSLTPGNIYIIIDVKFNLITDEVHTVVLYKPKKENGIGAKILFEIDEFLLNFKPVEKHVALAERKEILKQLESDATEVQRLIVDGLSSSTSLLQQIANHDAETIHKGREKLHIGSALPSPEMMTSSSTQLITSSTEMSQINEYKRSLENRATLGKLAGELAKIRTKELTTIMSQTEDFMMENAYAIQGKAEEMSRKVGDVMRKVDTMKLYLGEKVEVKVVIDGALSSSADAYTLYSQMVYMNEEIATHRIFSDDTFDYSNINDFFDFMNKSPDLVQRILPLQRCIVTIRPRRTSATYKDDDLTLSEWVTRDRANKSAFILVRNGEKVTAISSPVDYNQQLYPTDNSMNAFFEGVYADDVNLVNQQRQFANMAEDYLAVCATLQGISDREDQGEELVFGELPMRGIGRSFLTPNYANQNLRFYNDEDYVLANPDLPANIHKWFDEYNFNGTHLKGDIIIHSRLVVNEDTFPSAFRWVEGRCEHVTDWEIPYEDEVFSVAQMTLFRGEPCIPVQLTKWNSKQTKNFRGMLKKMGSNFINPMRMPFSVMENILASRQLREDLVNSGYMELLVEARSYLMKVFNEHQDIMQALRTNFKDLSDDDIKIMFLEWFIAVKDDSEKTSAAALKIIKRQYKKKMQFRPERIEMIAADIYAQGERPIFFSFKEGKAYIITTAESYVASFHVAMQSEAHPFFRGYLIKGDDLEDVGFIGSDIQSFPVTHLLTDNVEEFEFKRRRLSGVQWNKLHASTSKMMGNFRNWLSMINECLQSQSTTMTVNTINELFAQLEQSDEYAKPSGRSVTVALPVLPVSFDDSLSERCLDVISFNIPRAIVHLIKQLPGEIKSVIRHDINQKAAELLGWTSMVDKLNDISDISQIFFPDSLKVTNALLDKLHDTDTQVLSNWKRDTKKDTYRGIKKLLLEGIEQPQGTDFLMNIIE